ncbi:transposase [Streptomyces vinaceus]|uniref:transposase n=1 Tax=Streptomyces vinaceus TaxID=1960 RepID=UPI0036D0D3AA
MGSKYTKRYSDECKRDETEPVRSSGKTVTEVARELGVSSKSLRGWVKKARAAQDDGSGLGALRAADDRDGELKRQRKLTVEQTKTIGILKKGATAFFAEESDRCAGYAGLSTRRRRTPQSRCSAR